jgi:lambda family phage portal protein
MLGGLGVRTGAKLGFDGAGGGRHEDWYSGSARPINTLTKRDGARLRERSRDLTRNDLGAVSIVDKLAIAISGVRPRASTGNAQLDADIDGLFDEWERSASTAGYQTLSGLVWQAISALIDSGGALMRARARRLSDGLPVPMQLELLAVDHLRSDLTQRADGGGRIIQGVEFDALSRLTAYHLWRERPGSEFHDGQAVRVPESTIAHLYWAREIGQVRGVPWLSPAVAALRDLQLLGDAERTRAVGEASMVAFVHSNNGDEAMTVDGQDSTNRDDDGTVIEELTPGSVNYLREGQSVTFHSPSARTFDALAIREKAQVASALGTTYEQMTGDLSRTNWTSYKAGQIDHRARVRTVQKDIVIPFLLRRIWVWWIDAAVAAGTLPASVRQREVRVTGGGSYTVGYPVRWVLPNFEEVDRRAEALATKEQLRNGLTTHEIEWQRLGLVPAAVWDQLEREAQEAKRRGIVLDSMPSSTTSSGQQQATPPAPEEPPRNTQP